MNLAPLFDENRAAPGAHRAFVLCRQCGETLAPASVSGGTSRSPLCSCGVGRDFVSALEHSQQQLAG